MGLFNSLNSDDSCSYICQVVVEEVEEKVEEEWGGGGGRLRASPYIINGIVSMTLLTKQMHKSHRSESIDAETFNHVLNNDHCSHNAIIISRLRLG